MQPADNQELYRFLTQNTGLINSTGGSYGFPSTDVMMSSHELSSFMQSFCSSSSYYPLETSAITQDTTTTPHDRALAALKNHKEAEKRRRERINSHLDKLRTLLPCNSKVFIYLYIFFYKKGQVNY